MQWFAQAPSNIALIKYMGKKDTGINLPINASLSYTLHKLVSSVEIESQAGKKDLWEPLNTPGTANFTLNETAQLRFLNHFSRLKNHFDYQGGFIIRSNNNFPHSSGLASSASSFAALTKAACLALAETTGSPLPSIEVQANLSREGSGSSCRSFFSPWALWEDETVQAISLPYPELIHQAIIISHEEKSVSSREAHQRVKSSKLYASRADDAQKNLIALRQALSSKNWEEAYAICWKEFQGMHLLFSSADPAFTYLNEDSERVLALVQALWEKKGDGPIVTMDAGPNIHLLYRPDQEELYRQFTQDQLINNYDFI